MNKQLLLVDTNVISRALTKSQTKAYSNLFKELEDHYKFIISGYTKYELLCSSDKASRTKIDEYITNEMILVTLSQPLMDFASRVYNLYKKHPSTKGLNIGVGDIANAAFSIIKDCQIMTIDNNDYPRPFFIDVDRKRAEYISTKSRETIDTIYILKPDMDNLKECFNLHGV